MKNRRSLNQIECIKTRYSSDILELDDNLETLIEDTFEEQVAKNLISNVVVGPREKLFYNKVEMEEKVYLQSILATTIIVIASIGPIFGIKGVAWYTITTVTTALLGYYGFKHKIAGVISGLLMNIILYFIVSYCIADKTSFLYVYLVVPIFFTLAPTFLLYRLLSKIISHNNN